jgi:hypothetical protein
LAERVDALVDRLVLTLSTGRSDFVPVPCSVLCDPPYQNAALLLRETSWHWLRGTLGGARVVICEAEPLPLEGWLSERCASGKPEYVTTWGRLKPTRLLPQVGPVPAFLQQWFPGAVPYFREPPGVAGVGWR